jgi:hypothetical protein
MNLINWECSECGALLQSAERPDYCAACGLGGIIFCSVEDALTPENAEGAEWAEYFTELGLHLEGEARQPRSR